MECPFHLPISHRILTDYKTNSIDTGIDYTHPSLGGGFGPGHKVIGGYDFVGDAFTGSNTPQPDDDPMDECVCDYSDVRVKPSSTNKPLLYFAVATDMEPT